MLIIKPELSLRHSWLRDCASTYWVQRKYNSPSVKYPFDAIKFHSFHLFVVSPLFFHMLSYSFDLWVNAYRICYIGILSLSVSYRMIGIHWAIGLAVISCTFHWQKVFGVRKTSQNVYFYVRSQCIRKHIQTCTAYPFALSLIYIFCSIIHSRTCTVLRDAENKWKIWRDDFPRWMRSWNGQKFNHAESSSSSHKSRIISCRKLYTKCRERFLLFCPCSCSNVRIKRAFKQPLICPFGHKYKFENYNYHVWIGLLL